MGAPNRDEVLLNVLPAEALACVPLAEVDEGGAVTLLNAAGEAAWGALRRAGLPAEALAALRAQPAEGAAALPLPLAGRRALSLRTEDGWLLLGYDEAPEAGRAFADELPAPLLWLRRDGTLTAANEAAARATGYGRAEMLGRPFLLEIIHPEDRHRLTAALRAGAGRRTLALRLQRRDGEVRRAELLLQPLGGEEWAAVLTDVTEQDALEAALLQSEVLYQTFLEQSPVGVLHLDAGGVVTFENHRLRAMTGGEGPEATWLGRRLPEVDGLEGPLARLVERMLREGAPIREAPATFARAGGPRRHFLVHGTPIRHPEGAIVGASLMLLDVTAAREHEEELRLRRRYEEAEVALRNAALSHASGHAFLDEAARVIGETAGADQVYVLLPAEDADAYEEEARWAREPERSLVPLRLGPDEALGLAQGAAFYARRGLRSAAARALLEATGAAEVLTLPFVTEAERQGALLLVRREAGAAGGWRPAEHRALARLGDLFEVLWGWLRVEARYRQVVTTVEDSLFSFSFGPGGVRQFTFVTRQVEALTGHAPEALLSGAVGWAEAVVHEEDRAAFERHERALREGRESRLAYRIRTRGGALRWLRESATPSLEPGGRLSVAGILSDVSEAKEAEASLLRAMGEAEVADRLKASFLATMSHELRTPLGAIGGFAELLEEEVAALEAPAPEIAEFAGVIRTNARKVLRLVNNLFELASLQAGRRALERAPVPFGPLLERVAEAHRPALEARGLALELRPPPAGAAVEGDAQRIEQVLGHLLSNAVKFTEEGGVRLEAEAEADVVRVRVCDTGIGIGEEYLGRLFTPFTQEDHRLNREYEGSGLGLALAQRLVEAMGGSIRAESSKGSGTCFEVTLPRAEP